MHHFVTCKLLIRSADGSERNGELHDGGRFLIYYVDFDNQVWLVVQFSFSFFHVNLHVACVIPIFGPILYVISVSWSRNVSAVGSAL